MEKHQHLHRRELHLLPIPPPPEPSTSHHWPPSKPTQPPSFNHHHHHTSFDGPSLDLQVSITHPYKPPPAPREPAAALGRRRAELLRWQAAEQMRLAATERAYAERVRELTRREMELAQSELARAQLLWERTHDDVARAERIKQNSILRLPHPQQVGRSILILPHPQQVGIGTSNSNNNNNNNCIEIACHCCKRRFRP